MEGMGKLYSIAVMGELEKQRQLCCLIQNIKLETRFGDFLFIDRFSSVRMAKRRAEDPRTPNWSEKAGKRDGRSRRKSTITYITSH